MKAPPFGYVRATSLADVFSLWAEAGADAKLLAGGQTLLATLAFRLSEPTTLVDISRVSELAGINEAGSHAIRIGALTTHSELGAHLLVRTNAPLLAQAVPLIAHPAVRNRGTIGGSLAYADPAAELPACCVALEATMLTRSPKGERRVEAGQFFNGLYATALGENELITAVEVPKPRPGERSAIVEVARRSGDYAMAGVAVRAKLAGNTLIDPRIVFFGVGERPQLAERAMSAVSGQQVTRTTIAAAQAALDADLDPPADLHGGPEMKRHLARVVLSRAFDRLRSAPEARAA
jgi:aerobic carbon-monoxide dehydrogenase medium subunit